MKQEKVEWNIHRQIAPQGDGQRRWDLTYQCLLKWAQTAATQRNQEADHASSDLCPRINPTPGSDPDD